MNTATFWSEDDILSVNFNFYFRDELLELIWNAVEEHEDDNFPYGDWIEKFVSGLVYDKKFLPEFLEYLYKNAEKD
jgi:hypothetical protein